MDILSVRALITPASLVGYSAEGVLAYNSSSSYSRAVVRVADLNYGPSSVDASCPVLPGLETTSLPSSGTITTLTFNYQYMFDNFGLDVLEINVVTKGGAQVVISGLERIAPQTFQFDVESVLNDEHFIVVTLVPKFFF